MSQSGLIFVQAEHFGQIFLPYANYPAEIYLRACSSGSDALAKWIPDLRKLDFHFFWDDTEYVLFVSGEQKKHFPTYFGSGDLLSSLKEKFGVREFCPSGKHAIDLTDSTWATSFFQTYQLKPGPVIAGKFVKLSQGKSHEEARALQEHHWNSGAAALLEYAQRRKTLAEKARLFLSHRGADKEVVREIGRTLELIGVRTWLDESEMPAGTPIARGLGEGMRQCLSVAFFISGQFRDESFIRSEVDAALHEQTTNPLFRIIPLVLADHGGTDALVPTSLRVLRWVSVKDVSIVRTILHALPPELQSGVRYTPQ